MPDRCVVHGCSNRSDMNTGISAHFSPTIKSERDKWLRFVAHWLTARTSTRAESLWRVSVHFTEECFSRAVSSVEGCRRRLIPGLIPTIWKIDPGKQSSKRQHRKVSLF